MKLPTDQYSRIQYSFVQFLTEHLADASRAFGGDLQEMLVLAVIGQTALQSVAQGRENAQISASSLSDVTGIPRQTVRRKLASLMARGWVEQTEDSGWRLVRRDGKFDARQDLLELDQRGVERVIKLVRTLSPLIPPS